MYAAFYSVWFQTSSHTKAQEDVHPVSPCHWCTGLRKTRSGLRAILDGIHPRWGPEGGVWPMLDAVASSLVGGSPRGAGPQKMSGCRRNVKISKLRVFKAEAALLMQRCGSRLQAAHSDATSHASTQLWRDIPLWGLFRSHNSGDGWYSELLRDETSNVEVLVEPERHALSQP